MPENNFPVRTEIPVVPSVAAAITFLNFERKTPDEEWFKTDETYTKGRVDFNFDFAKKDKKEGKEEKKEEASGKEESVGLDKDVEWGRSK